jgi:hypothetical protein
MSNVTDNVLIFDDPDPMRFARGDDRTYEDLRPYLERVALCWTTEETCRIEMDPKLAEAFARMLRHDLEMFRANVLAVIERA